MRFKFIGTTDKIFNLITGENYEILQFEQIRGFMHAYVINQDKRLVRIPYTSPKTFNNNWRICAYD